MERKDILETKEKQMTSTQQLLNWIIAIEDGESPDIPYNLHPFIKCLCDFGTQNSIAALTDLIDMDKQPRVEYP